MSYWPVACNPSEAVTCEEYCYLQQRYQEYCHHAYEQPRQGNLLHQHGCFYEGCATPQGYCQQQVLNAIEGVQCGVPTRTTPTLTPTTSKNIEQTFLPSLSQVQPPEDHSNQAGFVPPLVQPSGGSTFISVDNKSWGGGVTTLAPVSVAVSSVPSSMVITSSYLPASGCIPETANSREATSSDSEDLPNQTSQMHLTSQAGLTSVTYATSAMSHAAMYLGNSGRRMGGRRPTKNEKLTPEETEKQRLRRERNKQAAARCRKKRLDQTNSLQGETDMLEEKKNSLQQEIHTLQQQRDELEFLLATHKAVCRRERQPVVSSPVVIKLEPPHRPCLSPTVEIKEEPLEEPKHPEPMRKPRRPQRPTSLPLAPLPPLGMAKNNSSVADIGVVIETPSAGLRGLNFESMMDGGTGLTPVSSMTPVVSTGLTPLTTPTVTAPSTNCGYQQRSTNLDLSSPDTVPPNLVSL